ncbi:hypothetical protein A5gp_00052 [Alteromonas phage vB_AemP_PT15-A5]|nr:hypothetical protein A5gp_00052 [Alteromonas phage vB_AemP_PT15-A5]
MQEKEGNLRSCAQCRFIFDNTEYDGVTDCILCGGQTLNAYHIHGKSTLKFLKSQQPFKQFTYAVAKEEALRDINYKLQEAVDIKRDLVKSKLNIPSHDDVLDASSLLNPDQLRVSKGSLPTTGYYQYKPLMTFEDWARVQNKTLAAQTLATSPANLVFPEGGVIGVSHENQKEEDTKTKKT